MSAKKLVKLFLFYIYLFASPAVVSTLSVQSTASTSTSNGAWKDAEVTINGGVWNTHLPRRMMIPFMLVWGSSSSAAFAAAVAFSSVEKDKEKIELGYKRLTYLIDNWDKETTFCNSGVDNPYIECERKPEKVMDYLGYKNQLDPLFRADKTLIRLQQSLVNLSPEDQAEFQDALDTWIEKAQEGNGLAYLSSWGEANPGGGKDRVALFLERSKQDVMDARDSLGIIINILNSQ